ncbi:MAG: Lon-like ATP-dependent protease, partial [Stygiobacter sp.]
EAAIDAGIQTILVPKSNLQDIVVDEEKLSKVKIIPVTSIQEVLEHALEWNGQSRLKEMILKAEKKGK